MNVIRRRQQQARRKQEGSVILIVLLVVMMTGGLAMFAAQSATFESRALGSTRQVQRLRRAGEGFLVAVESYLAERAIGGNGLIERADLRWTDQSRQNYRDAYGLPAYLNDSSLYQVRPEGFTGESYPLREQTSLPGNELSAGAVSPFVFDGIALIEMHEMPGDAGQGIGQNAGMAAGQKTFRACTTVYTRMSLPSESGTPGADPRAMHESVGVARAYFELR